MHTFAENTKARPMTAPAKSANTGGAQFGHGPEVDSPLHSRRKVGSQPLRGRAEENGRSSEGDSDAAEIARYGYDFGRMPVHARQEGEPAKPHSILRGCGGETVTEEARPIIGPAVEAMFGITIMSTTNGKAEWEKDGAFDWHVWFNTTGRNGWIVQEIVNTWQGRDKDGKPIPNPMEPHFWEAWTVNDACKVTPLTGDGKGHDRWFQPNLLYNDRAVRGRWSTSGKLYFTKTDPATQGFVINNKATGAGGLPSTTSAPANLGPVRLHRFASGIWDSTEDPTTGAARVPHIGLAYPP